MSRGNYLGIVTYGKSAHKLDNLTVIVDYNKIQGSGFVKDILDISSIPEVAKAIGWKVTKVDGHNIEDLKNVSPKKKINLT